MTDSTDPKQPLQDSDLDDLLAPTEEAAAAAATGAASLDEDEPNVGEPEPTKEAGPSLSEIKAELEEVEGKINELEEALTVGRAKRLALHTAMSKIHDEARNMPLHEMNRRQRAIAAGETALRLEAEEALGKRLRNARPRHPGDRPMTAIKRSLGLTDKDRNGQRT